MGTQLDRLKLLLTGGVDVKLANTSNTSNRSYGMHPTERCDGAGAAEAEG